MDQQKERHALKSLLFQRKLHELPKYLVKGHLADHTVFLILNFKLCHACILELVEGEKT